MPTNEIHPLDEIPAEGLGMTQEPPPFILATIEYPGYSFSATDCNCVDCCDNRNTERIADAEREEREAMETFQCAGCEHETSRREARQARGENYCEECFSDMFFRCHHCGGVAPAASRRIVEGSDGEGIDVCTSCRIRRYSDCHSCGNAFDNDDLHEAGDELYCRTCYEDTDDYHNQQRRAYRNGQSDYSAAYPQSFNWLPFDRRFGIELESCDEGGHHGVFRPVEDGSIEGDEYVSPIMLGDGGIQATYDLTKDSPKGVDQKCGYHIHLDATMLSATQVAKIVNLYKLFEPMFFCLVAPSRISNQYSRSIETDYTRIRNKGDMTEHLYGYRDEDGRVEGKYGEKRYEWVNVHSWLFRGTLEIRLHQGTFSTRKIMGWAYLHMAFMEWALAHGAKFHLSPTPVLSLEHEFTDFIKKAPEIVPYLSERLERFQHPNYDRYIRIIKEVI